jgi:hypothetical protein
MILPLLVCLLALEGVNTSAHAAPAAESVHGCPSGYACIYPEGNSETPSPKFYYYGVHRLSNQFNRHIVFNNQTGGALLKLCTDWNGNTCPYTVSPGGWGVSYDLTPINSVVLSPPGSNPAPQPQPQPQPQPPANITGNDCSAPNSDLVKIDYTYVQYTVKNASRCYSQMGVATDITPNAQLDQATSICTKAAQATFKYVINSANYVDKVQTKVLLSSTCVTAADLAKSAFPGYQTDQYTRVNLQSMQIDPPCTKC